jgi:hypothetical protein
LPFLLVLRKDLEKVYARPKRVNSLSYRADARNAGRMSWLPISGNKQEV